MSVSTTRPALAGAVIALALALGPLTPPSAAAPKTRNCATVALTFTSGATVRAFGIRATGYSCARARVRVRECLRDRLRGWRVSTAPTPDDRDPDGLIGLDRRSAHISFQVRGRGGCV